MIGNRCFLIPLLAVFTALLIGAIIIALSKHRAAESLDGGSG